MLTIWIVLTKMTRIGIYIFLHIFLYNNIFLHISMICKYFQVYFIVSSFIRFQAMLQWTKTAAISMVYCRDSYFFVSKRMGGAKNSGSYCPYWFLDSQWNIMIGRQRSKNLESSPSDIWLAPIDTLQFHRLIDEQPF